MKLISIEIRGDVRIATYKCMSPMGPVLLEIRGLSVVTACISARLTSAALVLKRREVDLDLLLLFKADYVDSSET